MHLLILSHAYPGMLEKVMEEFDKRGYIDDTKDEKPRYKAQWREVHLWDIYLPEGCQRDFLDDVACFRPPDEYLRKHSPRLASLGRLAKRLLRPFGLRSVECELPKSPRYPNRRIEGRPQWVWLEPLGTIPELRDPETGKELL